MEIFYFINLAIAISLILAPLWWSRRLLELPWLNPISLVTISNLPVEIFRLLVGQLFRQDGLTAPYYQFAVLMTNIQQLIALSLLIFAANLKITRRIAYRLPRFGLYNPIDLHRFSRVFFLLFLVAFLTLAIKTGGIADWLMDIRGSYIRKREGNGIFYAAAVSFISISYFFEGIANTSSRAFTIRSPIFFAAIYLLGSKGFVLQFFVFYLVIIMRQQRVNVLRVLMIALPTAFLLLLVNFFSQQDGIEIASVAEYFDYYPNAAMYYEDYFRGSVKLFDGEIMLSSLWEYVPRLLSPDKPYIYGILHVVEIYYPGGAESGNTPAFLGGVPQFADFGFPGVLIFALFNVTPLFYFAGLSYTLKDRAFLIQGPIMGRTILISLLLFAPAFGVFLPTGLLGLLLIFIICVIRLIKSTKFSF